MSKIKKPKFSMFTFVHICKDMPSWMSHFESDIDAIVDCTYAEKYKGDCFDKYSLFLLKDGIVTKHVAWYNEYQLAALKKQNVKKATKLVEDYYVNLAKERDTVYHPDYSNDYDPNKDIVAKYIHEGGGINIWPYIERSCKLKQTEEENINENR